MNFVEYSTYNYYIIIFSGCMCLAVMIVRDPGDPYALTLRQDRQ